MLSTRLPHCTVQAAFRLGILGTALHAPLAGANMLSISKLGAGDGTISSDNGQIDCGTTCMFDFPPSTEVQLSASAFEDQHARFISWSAGVCAGKSTVCAFAVEAPSQTIAAYFAGAGIAAGGYHTVALRGTDGTLWAWGKNDQGQLGDGSMKNSVVPVQVADLDSIDLVSAGYQYTVTLRHDGTVWAWGNNSKGQLGDGTTTLRKTPVQVTGLSGVITLSAGYQHTVALTGEGEVYAWGDNGKGQLGNDTITVQKSPVLLSSLNNVIAIATGNAHTVALRNDGTVWAWGDNKNGQLGNGTNTGFAKVPVLVEELTGVVSLDAGAYHTVVLKDNGEVWAWGDNSQGQLGDHSRIDRTEPVLVNDVGLVRSVSAGWNHTTVLTYEGAVWTWGDNWAGQLGDGSTTIHDQPQLVANLSDISAVTAGAGHTVALTRSGEVLAWGSNRDGALGDGTTTDRATFGTVPGINLVVVGHTVTVTAGANGTIVPASRTVVSGTTTTLTVTPKTGYIATVTGCGGELSGTTYTTGAITADCAVAATFKAKNVYAVTVQVAGNGTGTATGAGDFASGATVKLKATATDGATFQGWSPSPCTASFVMPAKALTCTATFVRAITPVVSLNSSSLALKSDGTVLTWGDAYLLGADYTTVQTTPAAIKGLADVSKVAVGHNHSVALKSDGTVWTWGANSLGQLGDGTTLSRAQPKKVADLSGVKDISANADLTAALKQDGTMWWWGQCNSDTEATQTQQTTPSEVPDLNNISAIAVGHYIVDDEPAGWKLVALKQDGTVWMTQLENCVMEEAAVVEGISNVSAIAAAYESFYALKKDGTVWAWGNNGSGQLGNGTIGANAFTPVQVWGLRDVTAISAYDDHVLALKKDGTVWAWGYGANGELGDGTYGTGNTRAVPTLVWALSNITAIAAGYSHSVALQKDGTLWAWGDNTYGQLGDGHSGGIRTVPVRVAKITDVRSIAAGVYHTLAVKKDGTVWGWGSGGSGELGAALMSPNLRLAPGVLKGLSGVSAIAGPSAHVVALKQDGTVWSWGSNSYGQLGNGSTSERRTPVQAVGLTDVVAVAAGGGYTVALKRDGTVWTWGYNVDGQLGDGTSGEYNERLIPAPVADFNEVTAIFAGLEMTVALKKDGSVWTWGYSDYGRLGRDGDSTVPLQIPELENIQSIVFGDNEVFALKKDGTVWAWGFNDCGELGDDNTGYRTTPTQIQGLTGVATLAASGCRVVATKKDGTLWAWGGNDSGQLGDGTTESRATPVQVKNLTGVVSVGFCGSSSTFAVKKDGTVWAWGLNHIGQLGDLTVTNRETPVQVYGLTGIVSVYSQRGVHSMVALKKDGTLWAWGDNDYGQLANGTKDDRILPMNMLGVGGTGVLNVLQ